MRIFVFNARRWYPALTALRTTALFLLLTVGVWLFADFVLDSGISVSAASDAVGDRVIIIDAGHGGEDCGAVGVSGAYEKDLNLALANTIGEELTERGFAVVFTRSEDKLLLGDGEDIYGMRKISDLKNRVGIAEKYPEALFLSIHMNSYKTEKYAGFQAYYNGASEDSHALAGIIQKNVRERLQPENGRVIKDGGELFILKNAPTVTVLLECGFLSNEAECQKLSEKEYQKELSFAIVCGIIEYIDGKSA